MLLHRVITAVVAVPILLGILFYGGLYGVVALLSIAFVIGMWEYASMAHTQTKDRVVTLAAGLWFFALVGVLPSLNLDGLLPASALTLAGMGAFGLAGLYGLFRAGSIDGGAQRVGKITLGVVYVAGLFAFLPRLFALGGDSMGPKVLLLLLAIVWMGDTGAYFAGRFLGKRKLYAKVSPKKTWAGAIGGTASSVLGAVLFWWILGLDASFSAPAVAIMAFFASVAEQVGDLFESLIKRSYGAKDSGNLLPGHGGILDRLDGVIAAAPVMFFFLRAVL